MASESSYTPSDHDTLLAKVGESVTFHVSATNDGNVDVDDTVVSDAGGCFAAGYELQPSVLLVRPTPDSFFLRALKIVEHYGDRIMWYPRWSFSYLVHHRNVPSQVATISTVATAAVSRALGWSAILSRAPPTTR